MRILYVTTVGITMTFFRNFVRSLLDEGHVVDIATNENGYPVPECYKEWGCKIYPISTSRSPFSFGNIKAIKQIRILAKNYDIVHCHTPLAGMATRLACKKLRKKNNLKVIYTAHGFHFYRGAPKKNWLIYYPIEKRCSKWTDVLFTITKEDFELAKAKMKAKKTLYIPGVGIDVYKFNKVKVDAVKKKEEIGIPSSSIMVFSVGELNVNKNHQVVIKALGLLKKSDIHYVIAGVGEQEENLRKLAKEQNVNLHLLGFRKDVAELNKTADLFILPSIREGLNVSMMEAMAAECPVLVSRIRGNVDFTNEKQQFNSQDEKELAEKIKYFLDNGLEEETENNFKELQICDSNHINSVMFDVYKKLMEEEL